MTGRRAVGPPRMLNCWLGVLLLLLSGRLSGVLFFWRGSVFPHVIGRLPGGLLVHFRTTAARERLAPLWFEGRMEVIRPQLLKRKTWRCPCPSTSRPR